MGPRRHSAGREKKIGGSSERWATKGRNRERVGGNRTGKDKRGRSEKVMKERSGHISELGRRRNLKWEDGGAPTEAYERR